MAYLRKTLHSLGGGTPVGASPFSEALAYAQFMRAAQPRAAGGGDGASDAGDDAVLRMALERMRQEGQDQREAVRQQGYEAYRNAMLQRSDADRDMRMKQFESAAQDRKANAMRQDAMFQNSEAWRRHSAMRQDERDREAALRHEQGRRDRQTYRAEDRHEKALGEDRKLLKALREVVTRSAEDSAGGKGVGANQFVANQGPSVADYQTPEARSQALDMLSGAATDLAAAGRRAPREDEAEPWWFRSLASGLAQHAWNGATYYPRAVFGPWVNLFSPGSVGAPTVVGGQGFPDAPPEDNGQALLAALYKQHRESGGR